MGSGAGSAQVPSACSGRACLAAWGGGAAWRRDAAMPGRGAVGLLESVGSPLASSCATLEPAAVTSPSLEARLHAALATQVSTAASRLEGRMESVVRLLQCLSAGQGDGGRDGPGRCAGSQQKMARRTRGRNRSVRCVCVCVRSWERHSVLRPGMGARCVRTLRDGHHSSARRCEPVGPLLGTRALRLALGALLIPCCGLPSAHPRDNFALASPQGQGVWREDFLSCRRRTGFGGRLAGARPRWAALERQPCVLGGVRRPPVRSRLCWGLCALRGSGWFLGVFRGLLLELASPRPAAAHTLRPDQ